MEATNMLKEIWAKYKIEPQKYAAIQLQIAKEKKQHAINEIEKIVPGYQKMCNS